MLNRCTLPLISALVVSASLASCQRKEVVSVPELPPAGEIGFTVSDSDAETKSTPLKMDYFSGEVHNPFKVVVYSHAEGATANDWEMLWGGTQTCNYDADYRIWKPSDRIKWPMTEEKLTFIAYAPTSLSPKTSSGGALTSGEAPLLKEYTVNSKVAQQVDILLATKESSASPLVQDVNVGLTFRHALTFVKFSIGENITCSSIQLSGIPGTGTLDMSTGAWSSVSGTKSFTIYPTFGDPDDNGQCLIDEAYTLMLIPQTLPADATLTAETSLGTITFSLAGQEWKPGRVVTYNITGSVFAYFTVSSSCDKVRFSPGNLQAVFAAPGTSFTWKFADNQWDYVGGRTSSGSGTETGNNFINGNGSVSAAGTVDLFGWSTTQTRFGIRFDDITASFGSRELAYSGDFVDWGSDPRLVSTLGSGWRTLSRDEWIYLFETRSATTVNGTKNARFAKAYLFGSVHGIIIFPDSYTHPDGVTLPSGINNAFDSDIWDSNQYDEDQWAAMESAGCVFLPAAGYRAGKYYSNYNGVGPEGRYWSSTSYYHLYFDQNSRGLGQGLSFERGLSVRLVQDL